MFSADRLGILVFLCTGSTLLAEIPTVTVCEAMREHKAYAGKSIVVVGRLTSTDEGVWLAEDCQDLSVDGKSEEGIISLISYSGTPKPPPLPSGPVWNQRLLLKKLQQVKTTTRLRPKARDSWFAVYGGFELGDDQAGQPQLVVAAACGIGPKGCVGGAKAGISY